jgi:hypothetical protein
MECAAITRRLRRYRDGVANEALAFALATSERMSDSTRLQTMGSDSISICGFMNIRAYHGNPSVLTGFVL